MKNVLRADRILQSVLLLVFLLFINIMILSAEDSAAVEVTAYPAPPVINNPWTLSLIVDYPYPDAVSVIEPEFPFFLDRILKYSKSLDTKIRTVFEYSFIPSESGSFLIEPFTVIFPDGITKTEPYKMDVRAINKEPALPVLRLFWEINSKKISSLSAEDSFQMKAGERALLVLRTNDRSFQSAHDYPPQEYFAPAAPQGAILALSPLSEEERGAGILLKLTFIPLKEDLRLGSRTLQRENFIFEIPPLFIRVNEVFAELGESSNITNMSETENFKGIIQENMQYSELSANINIQKVSAYNTSRKYYIVSFYFVIILVIFIPFVCFLLFKYEKK